MYWICFAEMQKEKEREREIERVSQALETPDEMDLSMSKDVCLVDNLSPPGSHTQRRHQDVLTPFM